MIEDFQIKGYSPLTGMKIIYSDLGQQVLNLNYKRDVYTDIGKDNILMDKIAVSHNKSIYLSSNVYIYIFIYSL